jgi:hypothetical protein
VHPGAPLAQVPLSSRRTRLEGTGGPVVQAAITGARTSYFSVLARSLRTLSQKF